MGLVDKNKQNFFGIQSEIFVKRGTLCLRQIREQSLALTLRPKMLFFAIFREETPVLKDEK
jgi:hypothetical protein